MIARWFTAPFIEREPLALAGIRDVFRHTSGEGYASNWEAIRDADLRGEAKTIGLPVLVIAGTHDLSTTAQQGRELAGYIEGARYVELDAAHLSNIEKRDDYTRVVLDFLGEKMTDDERYEAGMKVRRAVLSNAHVDRSLANRTDLTTDFQNFITCYAWARSGRATACRVTRAVSLPSR